MAAIAWPASIGAISIQWQAMTRSRVASSPRTGTDTIQQLPGERWLATVTFPPLAEADWRKLLGTLAALSGPVGQVLLPVLDYGAPLGGIVVPGSVLATGSPAAFTMHLTGIAGTAPHLKCGDLFVVQQRLYMATADVTAVAGAADVPIWPSVRGTPTAQAASFVSLVALMRLADDQQLKPASHLPAEADFGAVGFVEPLP